MQLATGVSGALEAGGVGSSQSAHSNEHLWIRGGAASMVDSPSGNGARRSGRARRPASTESEDFVGHDEAIRQERQLERQAASERN